MEMKEMSVEQLIKKAIAYGYGKRVDEENRDRTQGKEREHNEEILKRTDETLYQLILEARRRDEKGA